MNRRGFLGAILAAASAPAVVKANSLMKIWVPPQDLLVDVSKVGPYSIDEEMETLRKTLRQSMESTILMGATAGLVAGDLISFADGRLAVVRHVNDFLGQIKVEPFLDNVWEQSHR